MRLNIFLENIFYFSVVDVDCVMRIITRPRIIITEDDMITNANNVPAITESSSFDILSFMHLFYLRINKIKTPPPGSSLE